MPKKYDSTVARIAGNLLSGAFDAPDYQRIGYDGEVISEGHDRVVRGAVIIARAIVAEVQRTEPQGDPAAPANRPEATEPPYSDLKLIDELLCDLRQER